MSSYNREYQRNRRFQKLYGITVSDYEEMVRIQNGLCAACNRPPGKKPLRVDHDHNTGQVRGLLCDRCNTTLGLFRDDVNIIQRAIDYLEDNAANG